LREETEQLTVHPKTSRPQWSTASDWLQRWRPCTHWETQPKAEQGLLHMGTVLKEPTWMKTQTGCKKLSDGWNCC